MTNDPASETAILSQVALWLNLAASLATIAALIYAAYQVRQSRKIASASAAMIISERISKKIESMPPATSKGWSYAVNELFNDLELACALQLDGQYAGHTGDIAITFLCNMLAMIHEDDLLRNALVGAIEAPHTFECIKEFAKAHKIELKAASRS